MSDRRIAAKAAGGWWYRATDEQRLAQVSGGVECGMTAAQIATNCGCDSGNVRVFAYRHSAPIPRDDHEAAVKRWRVHNLRKAYLSGEPIDAWGAA